MRSKVRFIVALSLAALLGIGLVTYALGGARATYTAPGGAMVEGQAYTLNGLVAVGAPADAQSQALTAEGVRFTVEDQDDPAKKILVQYRGTIPDTFKDGREVVVEGSVTGGTFIAKRDSLKAKCPSKFDTKKSPAHENV